MSESCYACLPAAIPTWALTACRLLDQGLAELCSLLIAAWPCLPLPACPPAERCISFEECVAWARRKFQQQFHDRIAQVGWAWLGRVVWWGRGRVVGCGW